MWITGNYLVVVNPIVRANSIDAIVASQICASDCEMADLNIETVVKGKVKFGAINQDQVVDRRVGGRDQSYESWSVAAATQSASIVT